jgi:hypothetical protein
MGATQRGPIAAPSLISQQISPGLQHDSAQQNWVPAQMGGPASGSNMSPQGAWPQWPLLQ